MLINNPIVSTPILTNPYKINILLTSLITQIITFYAIDDDYMTIKYFLRLKSKADSVIIN
jgi:hypothetical protein